MGGLLPNTTMGYSLALGVPTAPAKKVSATVSQKNPADPSAIFFLKRCAGCHTIGGGKLTGPDLNVARTWPEQDLLPAIKRMEKNVGPLREEDMTSLMAFLKDAQVSERLKTSQAELARQMMATLAPASAKVGQALFRGQTPLRQGGIACTACHRVQGQGGTLGLELSGSFKKMGEVGLISAIENANFKIMDAAYRQHPITKQEAVHIAKFLATVAQTTPPADREAFLAPLGFFLALIFCSLVLSLYAYRLRSFRHPISRR
jgi:mono/diheme cytochrome c family protein